MASHWMSRDGLLEAQQTFRRLKATRQLPILRNTLQDQMTKIHVNNALETILVTK